MVPQDKVENFCVKVKEKINEEVIYDFIIQSVKTKGIDNPNEFVLFYSFLYKTMEYQISYYPIRYKKVPLLFELLPNSGKEFVLFIYQSSFVLMLNNRLYFYQNFYEALNKQEIIEYVKRRVSIEFFDVIEVDKLLEKKAEDRVNVLKKPNYFHIMGLVSYIAVIVLMLFFLLYQSSSSQILTQSKHETLKQQYQLMLHKTQFRSGSLELMAFFQNELSEYEIDLTSLKYQHRHFKVQLEAKEKKHLYDFIKSTTIPLFDSMIEFDALRKRYVLQTHIKSLG